MVSLFPIYLAAFSLCFLSVEGYSSGAPSPSCDSTIIEYAHTAEGKKIDPQDPTTNPYKITLEKTEVEVGSKVRVAISGGNGEILKGFVVLARQLTAISSEPSKAPQGTFFVDPLDDTVKTMTCKEGGEPTAVTHANKSHKTSAKMEWKAPNEEEGQYVIVATIAKDQMNYWMDVTSEVIVVHSKAKNAK